MGEAVDTKTQGSQRKHRRSCYLEVWDVVTKTPFLRKMWTMSKVPRTNPESIVSNFFPRESVYWAYLKSTDKGLHTGSSPPKATLGSLYPAGIIAFPEMHKWRHPPPTPTSPYTLALPWGHKQSWQNCMQHVVWSGWILRWGSCEPPIPPSMGDVNSQQVQLGWSCTIRSSWTPKDGCCLA